MGSSVVCETSTIPVIPLKGTKRARQAAHDDSDARRTVKRCKIYAYTLLSALKENQGVVVCKRYTGRTIDIDVHALKTQHDAAANYKMPTGPEHNQDVDMAEGPITTAQRPDSLTQSSFLPSPPNSNLFAHNSKTPSTSDLHALLASWDRIDEVDLYPALLWKPSPPKPKLTPRDWKLKRHWTGPGPSPLSDAHTPSAARPCPNLRAHFEARLAREASDEASDGFPKPLRQLGAWGAWAHANHSSVRVAPTRRAHALAAPSLCPALLRRRALSWLSLLPADAVPLLGAAPEEREFYERARRARGVEMPMWDCTERIAGRGTPPGARDFMEWPRLRWRGSKYRAQPAPEARLGLLEEGVNGLVLAPAYPDDASLRHWLTEKQKCLM